MKMAMVVLAAMFMALLMGGCAGTPVTVVSYNVDNFFGAKDKIPQRGDRPKSAEAVTALAAAIHQVNADVLVLQEVQTGGLLKEFNEKQLADMGYSRVVVDEAGDTRGLTLAVLSRYPVVQVVSHKEVPLDATLKGADAAKESNHFARDLFRVDVKLPSGKALTIYDLHLKSTGDFKDDPKSAKWRLREATRAAAIVREETDKEGIKNFVVAGDFNEPANSAAVQAVIQGAGGLRDALADAKERDTFVSGKVKSAVDDILLSPGLSGKAEVVDGPTFAKASSHRPVKVVLKL